MKISASKKQLAKIISENGGWRDGSNFYAQDGCGEVWSYIAKPSYHTDIYGFTGDEIDIEFRYETVKNFHQTIISRDEYFHLHPAPDSDHSEDSLDMVEPNPAPTIEQLAAEYRNRKDYAERKQQEADEAKAEAEAKLAELVAAGKAVGLGVSVPAAEPELVITDWRDLQVGDEVEYLEGTLSDYVGLCGVVDSIDRSRQCGDYRINVKFQNGITRWCNEWRFIRRPAKEADNA